MFATGSGRRLWEVPSGSFISSNLSESLQWEQGCPYRHPQDKVRMTADIPPRLDGTWVSTRWASKSIYLSIEWIFLHLVVFYSFNRLLG